MKKFLIIILALALSIDLFSQVKKTSKTRFITGLSAPELFHVGATYRLANICQLGLNAGIGPSYGLIWTAISLENRIYFGKSNEKSDYKTWFCRQGTTFFPSAEKPSQYTFNLTIGKDIPFKKINNGITIDFGVFYLPGSEDSSIILVRSLNLWPALRIEFYFSL